MVLGLRGFPDVQGGVETHSEHLYPLLMELGCQIDVITRSPYMPPNLSEWRGVRFHRLWAPKSKSLETIIHSILGVFYAAVKRPDVLHIHAIGPSLVVPLARLLGLRVVTTHHGFDYDREKWAGFASRILRLGEKLGAMYASECIVISNVIKDSIKIKYDRETRLIPNGVVIHGKPSSSDMLNKFDLKSEKYILLVSRLVPEKRHLDLIEAYRLANLDDWKLVLVGATEHPDDYSQQVIDRARDTPDVITTGYLTGEALQEIYANAGLFVLPSSHEGLPIALLEALSYGLTVIASDIPANLEVGLPADQYYELGDIEGLRKKLADFSRKPKDNQKRSAIFRWLESRYDWRKIAKRTLDVYELARR